MWIKICGNTSLEDAQLAVDAGADALGFVFALSPRRVTPQQVAEITRALPRTVEKIGVFVDAGFDEIVATILEAGLTGVQLHGDVTAAPDLAPSLAPSLAKRLRQRFANGTPQSVSLGILHVLNCEAEGREGNDTLQAQLKALRQNHAVDAVLVDSRSPHARGGTGMRFDWQAARRSFSAAAPHLRIIVAGGLNPENVREAIHTLHPWGVDVVTGVEAAPGRKDPARVKEFIAAARAAAESIRHAPAAEA